MNGAHDVRIFIEESQECFQTPEEAFQAAQQAFGEVIVVLLQLLIDVLEHDANQTANGDDQRTKYECAQMVSANG